MAAWILLLGVVVTPATSVDFSWDPDTRQLNYAYYRSDNYDSTYDVPAVAAASGAHVKAQRRAWNTTYRIFDSKNDTHVTRFDVSATEKTQLGERGQFLKLRGPAYFMTTAPVADLNDVTKDAHAPARFGMRVTNPPTSQPTNQPNYEPNAHDKLGYNSMAFVTGGSCIALSVEAPDDGKSYVSILVASSGPLDASFSTDKSGCVASTIEIGYKQLHNNPVDYITEGECKRPLHGPGGAADYDDLDQPIRPLQKHYHTRGALYYVATGSAVFDEGVPALMAGELRFVRDRYYYGPETMNDKAFVSSLHEPDPTARHTGPRQHIAGPEYTPCVFACLDDPATTKSPLVHCVKPKN